MLTPGAVFRRTASALITCAAIIAATTSCGDGQRSAAAEYCATLTDAVGLYVGNPVTQMGYRIGSVESIDPGPTSVTVRFSVTSDRQLPQDVKAVIRSSSILADRALELVGNYHAGPRLSSGRCIPLEHTATPKSLSELVGSANDFITGITPRESSNMADTVSQLAQAMKGNGSGINEVLTVSSRLLANPQQQIGDMSAIVGNLATLSRMVVDNRDPLKGIIDDALTTTPNLVGVTVGASQLTEPLPPIISMISDVEVHAGDELQLTLDSTADTLRILTPRARWFASLLDPIPWWINTAANHVNNREFHLSYRPPLYRIRTPDGPLVCAIMNASNPGSCAVVAGQPYGVDINLLQYVFMKAAQ